MIRIGTMQGRLVSPEGGKIQFFPRERWKMEFPLAVQAGFELIEWLYDVWGESHNPLASDNGIQTMAMLSQESGMAVHSLCAHYFVERPFVKNTGGELDKLVTRLGWLASRCGIAGIRRLVVPFLDDGAIRTIDDERLALDVLCAILPLANEHGLEIHLESSLTPAAYTRFLDKLPAPEVKVTYDTGNSASWGFDIAEEIRAYGSRIGSVHIKDRLRNGGSVPLGTGDARLGDRLEALLNIGYTGDFVLEAARGESGDELAWAKRNLSVTAGLLAETGVGARL
jgi:L-ribulose-5-phosphate 3-epimerase